MSTDRQLTVRERRELRVALLTDLTRAEELSVTLGRDLQEMVSASEGSNSDDEHDPEGMSTAFEKAQLIGLLRQSDQEQAALRLALDRLEEPGFGLCEHCAEFIGVDRLLALPAATRCITCAL